MSVLKVATAAYPLSWFEDWSEYEAKMHLWVAEAAGQGAELLLFPEYGAMELASFADHAVAADRLQSSKAVSDLVDRSNAVLAALAQDFSVMIIGGSAPVVQGEKVVNRTPVFGPSGSVAFQDKQIMTRFERDDLEICGGGPLRLFETGKTKIGILTCYDSQFPLIGRALVEAGAEVILAPSCTGALDGYWRVRLGAMARALEGQCVTVMASVVGARPEIYGVEVNTGMGAVFGPPDNGFPPDGVIAVGTMDQAGWTYADIDLDLVRKTRADGKVLNATHWTEQAGRDGKPEHIWVK